MKTKKQIERIQTILAMNFRRATAMETVSSSWIEGVMNDVTMIGPLLTGAGSRNGLYIDRIFWRVAWASITIALLVAILGFAEYVQFQSSLVQIAVEDPAELTTLVMNF